MTVSHEGSAPALSVVQVLTEAKRRVGAAIEVAAGGGREELAEELAEFAQEFDPTTSSWDIEGRDWALPHALAALLGVTLRDG